jgi:hypothetical protein
VWCSLRESRVQQWWFDFIGVSVFGLSRLTVMPTHANFNTKAAQA